MQQSIRIIERPQQVTAGECLVITHSGPAHADDCAATALLSIYMQRVAVIRTRETALLTEALRKPDWFVIDVGGELNPQQRNFDHHFHPVPQRPDGIPYSSLGLVAAYLEHRDHDDLIRHIDAVDNGVSTVPPPDWWMGRTLGGKPCSVASMVHLANPLDAEGQQGDAATFDAFFAEIAETMRDLFAPVAAPKHQALLSLLHQRMGARQAHMSKSQERMATVIAAAEAAQQAILVLDRFETAALDCLAARPTQSPLRFLVFPGPDLWMVQQIPLRPGSHAGRQALPAAWAGLRDHALAAATGVADAVFCHPKCFIAGASSRDGAVALAQLSLAH